MKRFVVRTVGFVVVCASLGGATACGDDSAAGAGGGGAGAPGPTDDKHASNPEGGTLPDAASPDDAPKPSDGFFVPPAVGSIAGFEHIVPDSYKTVTDVSCDATACVFGIDSMTAWRLPTGASTLEQLPGDQVQLESVLLHGGELFAA